MAYKKRGQALSARLIWPACVKAKRLQRPVRLDVDKVTTGKAPAGKVFRDGCDPKASRSEFVKRVCRIDRDM